MPLRPGLQTGQHLLSPFLDDALNKVRKESHDRRQADAELNVTERAGRGAAATQAYIRWMYSLWEGEESESMLCSF